jgi:Family of unknown function (DUF6088)
MNESTEIRVFQKIGKARRGSLFFVENFLKFGTSKAVSKALERLVKRGELSRVATGIYARPQIDPIIGPVTPNVEAIASAIAKRDKARIVPTGIYALNKLGLSTQIPLNVVYLTDGAARKIKIGKQAIIFKKTAPKNLTARGEISRLVIQALRTIGKDNLTQDELVKIHLALKKEKTSNLGHDIMLAPDWIRKVLTPFLKQISDEH